MTHPKLESAYISTLQSAKVHNFKKEFIAFDITRDFQTGRVLPDFKLPAYGPVDNRLLLTPDQLKNLETRVKNIYRRYLNKGYYNH